MRRAPIFQKENRPRGNLPTLIVGLVLTFLFALLVIFQPLWIHLLDMKVYDSFLRMDGGGKPSGKVTVVAIDDRSLKEFGQWPWPRYRVAQLLDKIRSFQPLAVGIDILFTEADRTSPRYLQETMARDFNIHIRFEGLPERLLDNDHILATTLSEGPYVAGFPLQFTPSSTQQKPGCRPLHPTVQTRPGFPSLKACLPRADAVECPLSQLEKAVAGYGFINAIGDADGVVRRIPMLVGCHDDIFPSLALATLLVALSPDASHPITPIVRMGRSGLQSLQAGDYIIPVDAAGDMLIHYYPRPNVSGCISADDVLNNRVSPEILHRCVVFVGLIASGLKDAVATPMSPFCPGVMVHASAVDTILQTAYVSEPAWIDGFQIMAVIGAGMLVAMGLAFTSGIAGLATCGILATGLWGGAWGLFHETGIFISPLTLCGLLLSQLMVLSLLKLRQSQDWTMFFRLTLTRAMVSIQSMKAAKELSELASQLKSDFLARMSHEIRTPMNAILGMAELLSETSLTDEQKDYLQTLKSSGELLLALINDILDLSKIEAGQLTLESVSIDIRKLLEGVVAILSHRARQQGIEMSCRVAADVPQYLMGDPIRIQQIVMNLLGNALKFTSKGFIRIEMISPDSGNTLNRYQIEVQDSGIGIAPEKQSEIFESFVQADASITRQYGGTGLGLAITKRLIEKMGGSIRVESTPGQGSNFIFSLILPKAEAPPEAVSIENIAGVSRALPAVRLLLVDDVPVNRKIVEAYLKNTQIHVETAENGRQALDLWTNGLFDIILMDMEMPVMNGFEATRRIRQAENERGSDPVPIVALTAHAFSEERQRCMDAGCTYFFTKPVRKADLLQLLQNIFGVEQASTAP